MLLGLALLAALAQAAPLRVAYVLTPFPPRASAEARTVVEMRVTGLLKEKAIRLQMPVWSPGDYHVQNHGRHVRDLRAAGPKGEPLSVTRPDENDWEIETGGANEVTVTYELPNAPPGFFTENVQVKERHAFYNGPATYLYVVGHKNAPATVHIALPEGWQRAITPLDPLPPDSAHPRQIGFSAPDYDTLADAPVLVGDYATREFTHGGRPHILAFFNSHRGLDYDAFVPILQKIVAEQCRMMGGPPYKRYLFFFDVNGRGGALEHLNSARIAWPRSAPVRFVARVAAHEFFHLWNVKRIRPAALGPFDYVKPPRTRNLWFCEGVTDYVAALSVRRAGLESEAEYLAGLSGQINALQAATARRRVTADESSLRVWEANNSSGYGGLNYYLKGHLIGLCLDLKIRGVTNGRAGLDDLMRDLLARYGLPKPGFPEDGIREAVIRIAGPELGPFYDLLCRSTEEMPFAECLRYAGLRLRVSGGQAQIEPDPAASPEAQAIRRVWLSGDHTLSRSLRPGLPTITLWGATSLTTTAPMPIRLPRPIRTS